MKAQNGFTIIEVIMFLAISALLLTSVMAGITGNINSTRFLSATKDFQAFLQKQYDATQSGLANRPNEAKCPYGGKVPAGASDNCLIIGRLVVLKDHDALAYSVVSTTQPVSRCHGQATGGGSDAAKIFSYCPVALGTSNGMAVEDYKYNWGISMYKAEAQRGNGVGPFKSIAILKSPESGNMYTTTFNNGPQSAGSNYTFYSQDLQDQNRSKAAAACLKSPDIFSRTSYVLLSGGLGADVISTGDGSDDLPGGLKC